MRIGYADPPYPGMAERHYGDHEDFAGEVDHHELLGRLASDFDGWLLHTSSTALPSVLAMASDLGLDSPADYRVMAWVKPFAVFKQNVSVAYAWEPVLVAPCRKPVVAGRVVMRDWISESITLQRGLVGVKPSAVCRWAFEVLGAEADDELVDLYPGSGAVARAWESWRTELRLELPRATERRGETPDTEQLAVEL